MFWLKTSTESFGSPGGDTVKPVGPGRTVTKLFTKMIDKPEPLVEESSSDNSDSGTCNEHFPLHDTKFYIHVT